MFTISRKSEAKGFKVEFLYALEKGHQVMLAGSFNDWEQIPMLFSDGAYRVTVELSSGDHEYRFVVDDTWQTDETNPNFTANDFGTLNSVLHVD